jgi:acyl-CoA synthetase (NDP forming)/GNAT superfamily N-acetyltransferase
MTLGTDHDAGVTAASAGPGGWRAADVLLADGSTVHMRQITPDDADRVVAMHARFSDRTRYLRYFSPYPRIPPRDLAHFVNVDHDDREALVAVVGDDLIAVGRYDRLGPDSRDAEVAFVVEDAYQGRGVGSILLEHLAAVAAQAGVTRFVAEVLPQNGTMLRVFGDAGYQVSREYADGVVHLTFPIAPTARSVEVARSRDQHNQAASVARLLAPRVVTVYGVRRDGTGVGAALLRHITDGGFTGTVRVVHPEATAADAGPVDMAVVAVPADRVAAVVDDAGASGTHAMVVVSSGFAELDQAGALAQAELVAAARAVGMRLVGPNALGVVNTDPAVSLNASLAPQLPRRGRVGLFCQSGALGIAVLAEAHTRELGLSTFVSAGNRADVSGNDLLQFWRTDPGTDVVLLYLETFGNPRTFARIAREVGRDKPIVVVATGSAGLGGAFGAVALDADATAALFARSGIVRVATISELFDVGEVFARQPLPTGRRVRVLGNSPALVSLATGTCARAGLSVVLPGRSVPVPVGVEALAAEIRAASAGDEADAVLVVIAPALPEADLPVAGTAHAGGDGGLDPGQAVAAYLGAVAAVGRDTDTPVVVTMVGAGAITTPNRVPDLPVFATVEEAVRALAHVVRYAMWRREPTGTLPDLSTVDLEAARGIAAAEGPVDGLLAAYGVSVLPALPASDSRSARAGAERLGYPVALKAAAAHLRHRLDLGAVRLNLADARAVSRAYGQVAAQFGPDVLVQAMAPPGVACVVELVDDPVFGPIVGFGLGGVASDLLGDRAWRTAPLTDIDAAALVRAPRAAALLGGYRGAAPADVAALADLLIRVGQLADEIPQVKRLVLNPVLAHPEGISVLHASVTYGEAAPRPDTGPRRLP